MTAAMQTSSKTVGSQKTKWNQPVGHAVSFTTPPPRPSRVTLQGPSVTIKPLHPDHANDLYTIIEGEDKAHLFTYLFDEPYTSAESFQAAVTVKSQSEDPLFFAISIPNNSNSNSNSNSTTSTNIQTANNQPSDLLVVGWLSLMRISPAHRVVEIGNILFSPLLQRTKAATEAMYLMAKYVFETLGYRRYEWKCDNMNAPSKRAALRFGFTFEGVFRQHMIYKGRSRDTAWFSIVDTDWPVVKRGFEAWLDDANFGADGLQKQRLEVIREQLDNQRSPIILEV
ncbi:hypothetical protein A1O1_01336 [Capronia coronata CBS 617.96]|uniref:N-acetyltransferase domain-containing protein n=1 Tax=Capronia coronata CBS 617.96 TaxID=1182541 RepID=W9Z2L6_9EURO|nr:uncharacterized protein A1O1_01336 [Capronia coronata CBS 617.96]EXJ96210.1 hypothetical protein A1O1_01336 [Capronia coronata CBS 617.96]